MTHSPAALIFGISGQDGRLLARFLVDKGYQVFGVTRSLKRIKPVAEYELWCQHGVHVVEADILSYSTIESIIIETKPDEIYFLAGQSSVGLSFSTPYSTFSSNVTALHNILEVCRVVHPDVKIFNAGSSEVWGEVGCKISGGSAHSKHQPVSPYGFAKSASILLVNQYRELHGLYACSGITTNHESYYRSSSFVTHKIAAGIATIYLKKSSHLKLGNINIYRDWGWAEDYVLAMWTMLTLSSPKDFVIATGKAHSLLEFVHYGFNYVGLDSDKHLVVDSSLCRPTDITFSKGDPSALATATGWKAKTHFYKIIELLVTNSIERHVKT
jgi:GDPmannose 4,6-dehydratase